MLDMKCRKPKGLQKLKLLAIFAIVAISAITMTACGGKGNKKDWDYITSKGTLIMGFDASFPPMGFSQDGEYVGFDFDLAKEMMKLSDFNGLELKLQPIDWSMKEQDLKTKKIDVIWNGFTITEARATALNFSIPYMTNRQVVVVKGGSINAVSGLSGLTIGYQNGSSALAAIQGNDTTKDLSVTPYEDNVMILNELVDNVRIQAAVMDEVVARYLVASNPSYAGLRVIDETLAYEEFGIGMRKGDNQLKYKIDSALRKLAADGKIQSIAADWFNSTDALLTVGGV